MKRFSIPRLRFALAALAMTVATACSGGGIDAGVDGGVAFIAFTGMLIVAGIILWLTIGRED